MNSHLQDPRRAILRKPIAPLQAKKAAPAIAPQMPRDLVQRAQDEPSTLNSSDLLYLQSSIGNRAVSDLLSAKESEASPMGAEGGELDGDLSNAIQRAQSGGSALPKGVAAEMQGRTGLNTAGVRIHTGDKADTLNRRVNAEAFTLGRDVFFSKGAYRPESSSGKQLLAHELTHVAQQAGAPQAGKSSQAIQPKLQAKLQVGAANDRFEREADLIAGSLTGSFSGSFSGSKGAALSKVQPSVQSGAAPAVQRKMKFERDDLKGDSGRGGKLASKVGFDSTFQKLRAKLDAYWNSGNDLAKQEALLNELMRLTDHYLRSHKRETNLFGSNGDTKMQSVTRLRWEIMVEREKFANKHKNRDFMKKFHKDSPHLKDVPMIEPFKDPRALGKQVAQNEKHLTAEQKQAKAGKPEIAEDFSYSDGVGGMDTKNKLGPSVKKAEHDKYKAQKSLGLTQAHRAALNEYTSNQYMFMNPAMAGDAKWMKSAMQTAKDKNLIGGNVKDDDATITKMIAVNKEMGSMVTSALNRLPLWKQTQTVYRGDKVTEEEADNIKVGYEKKHPYFVSTSLLRKTPESQIKEFRNPQRPWGIIFHITQSKTGRDISKFSITASELEVLYPANTKFVVTKVLSKDTKDMIMEVEVKAI